MCMHFVPCMAVDLISLIQISMFQVCVTLCLFMQAMHYAEYIYLIHYILALPIRTCIFSGPSSTAWFEFILVKLNAKFLIIIIIIYVLY